MEQPTPDPFACSRACRVCHVAERQPSAPRKIDIGPAFRDIANTPGMTATANRVFGPGTGRGNRGAPSAPTRRGSVRKVQQKPLRRWSWYAGDIAITGSFGEDAHHDQQEG